MYFASNIDVATEFSWRFECCIYFLHCDCDIMRCSRCIAYVAASCSHPLDAKPKKKKTKSCFDFPAAIAIKAKRFLFVRVVQNKKQHNVMVLLLLTEPVTNIDIYLANVVFFHRAHHTIESGRPLFAHIKYVTCGDWLVGLEAQGRRQKSSCRFSFTLVTVLLLLLLSLPLWLFCIRLHIMSMQSPDNMRSPLSFYVVYCSLLVRHIDCNLQQIKHTHQPATTTTTTTKNFAHHILYLFYLQCARQTIVVWQQPANGLWWSKR